MPMPMGAGTHLPEIQFAARPPLLGLNACVAAGQTGVPLGSIFRGACRPSPPIWSS